MKRFLQRRGTGSGKSGGYGCLALFALPFAAAGVVCLYLALAHLVGWWSARSWIPTPVRLESVNLESSTSDGSTTYRVTASYRYTFEGLDIVGSRVGLSGISDNIGSFHEDAYDELRAAKAKDGTWTAFVNPKDPSQALLYREARWGLVGFWGIFIVLFGGVGFGLLASIPWARRKEVEEARLKTRHPDEPWKWRDDWQGPVIRSSAKVAFAVPLVFAMVWNAVSLPAVFGAWDQIFSGEEPLMLLVLLFPLFGIGMLVWAWVAFLRWRLFGDAQLVLGTLPVRRGGELAGRVLAGARLSGRDGRKPAHIDLRCHRSERQRSGSKTRNTRKLLWQEQQTVPVERLVDEPTQTAIPVRLVVPDDVPETDEGKVSWSLDVRVERKGVDFVTSFEVPVYGTASEEERERLQREEAQSPERVSSPGGWSASGVHIVPHEGGSHYVFARARQKGPAIGTTVFALIWTAVCVGLYLGPVPRIMVFGFGLFELILLYVTIDLWLRRREIVASPSGLAWRTGLLRMGQPKSVAASDVRKIEVKEGMQMGNRLYYRLMLEASGLKNDPVLADKIEGAAPARELRDLILRDLGLGDHEAS
ncbi:MAG: DUF3592 domain-containing protein [Acidobacteriota bacterium]